MKNSKRRNGRRSGEVRTRGREKPTGPKTREIVTRHAIRRAYERYDLRLTMEDVDALSRAIQSNNGTFVNAQSATRTHWLVEHKGVVYPVVYNRTLKCVTTFLPDYVRQQWREESEMTPG